MFDFMQNVLIRLTC